MKNTVKPLATRHPATHATRLVPAVLSGSGDDLAFFESTGCRLCHQALGPVERLAQV